MGKRRQRGMKEGELANFPEETPPKLMSPRYLAVATSLVLVFSAFASLLVREDITGQVTSPAIDRWRGLGWERYSQYSKTNDLDAQGRIIISDRYRCPKTPTTLPTTVAATDNGYGCANFARDATRITVPMCMINQNGKKTTAKCILQ